MYLTNYLHQILLSPLNNFGKEKLKGKTYGNIMYNDLPLEYNHGTESESQKTTLEYCI